MEVRHFSECLSVPELQLPYITTDRMADFLSSAILWSHLRGLFTLSIGGCGDVWLFTDCLSVPELQCFVESACAFALTVRFCLPICLSYFAILRHSLLLSSGGPWNKRVCFSWIALLLRPTHEVRDGKRCIWSVGRLAGVSHICPAYSLRHITDEEVFCPFTYFATYSVLVFLQTCVCAVFGRGA